MGQQGMACMILVERCKYFINNMLHSRLASQSTRNLAGVEYILKFYQTTRHIEELVHLIEICMLLPKP